MSTKAVSFEEATKGIKFVSPALNTSRYYWVPVEPPTDPNNTFFAKLVAKDGSGDKSKWVFQALHTTRAFKGVSAEREPHMVQPGEYFTVNAELAALRKLSDAIGFRMLVRYQGEKTFVDDDGRKKTFKAFDIQLPEDDEHAWQLDRAKQAKQPVNGHVEAEMPF